MISFVDGLQQKMTTTEIIMLRITSGKIKIILQIQVKNIYIMLLAEKYQSIEIKNICKKELNHKDDHLALHHIRLKQKLQKIVKEHHLTPILMALHIQHLVESFNSL